MTHSDEPNLSQTTDLAPATTSRTLLRLDLAPSTLCSICPAAIWMSPTQQTGKKPKLKIYCSLMKVLITEELAECDGEAIATAQQEAQSLMRAEKEDQQYSKAEAKAYKKLPKQERDEIEREEKLRMEKDAAKYLAENKPDNEQKEASTQEQIEAQNEAAEAKAKSVISLLSTAAINPDKAVRPPSFFTSD